MVRMLFMRALEERPVRSLLRSSWLRPETRDALPQRAAGARADVRLSAGLLVFFFPLVCFAIVLLRSSGDRRDNDQDASGFRAGAMLSRCRYTQ